MALRIHKVACLVGSLWHQEIFAPDADADLGAGSDGNCQMNMISLYIHICTYMCIYTYDLCI